MFRLDRTAFAIFSTYMTCWVLVVAGYRASWYDFDVRLATGRKTCDLAVVPASRRATVPAANHIPQYSEGKRDRICSIPLVVAVPEVAVHSSGPDPPKVCLHPNTSPLPESYRSAGQSLHPRPPPSYL